MKSLAVLLVFSLASTALAADRPQGLAPVLGQPVLSQAAPAPAGSGLAPVPDQGYVIVSPATPGQVVVASPVIALYGNVRYKDLRNVAPCAVPTIVQVPDPCNAGCCVNVEICVPPCETACIKVKKCGNKVKYDYGKYAVEITSARGRVTVDYDD